MLQLFELLMLNRLRVHVHDMHTLCTCTSVHIVHMHRSTNVAKPETDCFCACDAVARLDSDVCVRAYHVVAR